MKKIILLFVALFFMVSSADAKKITVFRKGSEDGVNYNRVAESHALFKSSLSCIETGAIHCGWAVSPSIGGFTADEIEAYVMLQIDSGDLNGNTNYNGSVYVTWNYDADTDELVIVMDDGQI